MDFLTWWFDTHYIASTIFTPFFTWMWLIFNDGNGWREFVAVLLWLGGNILTNINVKK